MTLAKAKAHIKAYLHPGPRAAILEACARDGSDPLREALAAVVRSWSSKAQGGKASRNKGHGYERDVANYLKPIYPGAKRGLQSREGAEAPDVEGTPLFLECKRHRKITGALTLYRKAASDAAKDPERRPPVMVLREDGGPEVALMPLALLLSLLATVECEGRGSIDIPGRAASWTEGGDWARTADLRTVKEEESA